MAGLAGRIDNFAGHAARRAPCCSISCARALIAPEAAGARPKARWNTRRPRGARRRDLATRISGGVRAAHQERIPRGLEIDQQRQDR